MRSRTVLRIGLPIASLAVVGALCVVGGVPTRACQRVHRWLVWGGADLAPPADSARVLLPLRDAEAITVSGTIRYQSGHLGAKRHRDLPMRRIEVEAGGISVRIEDAARSSIAGSRELTAGRGKTLVASTWGWFAAGDQQPINFRYYHFRPGEPVELELPFSITVTPVSDAGGGRFSVALGDMKTEGERRWSRIDEVWEPMPSPDRRARVSAVMVHWRERTRCAAVSLEGVDPTGAADVQNHGDGRWRLRSGDGAVVCEALATGVAAERAVWR
ncbi:MAG: hypothetical protein ACOX9R_14655 [Armatimonadota bacterium]|jgi:hypothetical protein